VSGRAWARLHDVALHPVAALDFEGSPALRQAYADGIERGFAGELPALPSRARRYLIRSGGEDVGLLALVEGCPTSNEVAVVALAVEPGRRGRAYAAKALLAAERRLRREGASDVVSRVPRTNGRGLYFMLRAGLTPYVPGAGTADRSATWFRRGGSN
jgi:GNAT superfamily N-acetyltransferase